MIQKSVSFLSELLVLTVWNFLEARINKHFFSRQVLDPLEVSSLMRSNSYIITLEEKYLILGHRGLAWSKLSQRPLTKHTALAIHFVFLQWCPGSSSQPWSDSGPPASLGSWAQHTQAAWVGAAPEGCLLEIRDHPLSPPLHILLQLYIELMSCSS